MRYLVSVFSLVVTGATPAAFAGLLSCVDPDVAAVFVHSGYSSPSAVSREVPVDFPSFKLPRSLTLIGSSTRTKGVMVGYKTDLPVGQAEEQIVSFVAVDVPTYGSEPTTTGNDS